MTVRLLRLPIAIGVLLTAIGVGTLLDGDLLAGLAALAAGLLLAGVPAAYLVSVLRAAGTDDVTTSPAMADPVLARDFGAVGTGLVAFGLPWFAATFALLVVLYRMAADDDAGAGAVTGIMVLACLFAAIPGLLGYGLLRAGRLVRRGVTSGIESARQLSRLVIVLAGLTTVLSITDDRPAYRVVAVVAACVVAGALFNSFRLTSLQTRVLEYENRVHAGIPAA